MGRRVPLTAVRKLGPSRPSGRETTSIGRRTGVTVAAICGVRSTCCGRTARRTDPAVVPCRLRRGTSVACRSSACAPLRRYLGTGGPDWFGRAMFQIRSRTGPLLHRTGASAGQASRRVSLVEPAGLGDAFRSCQFHGSVRLSGTASGPDCGGRRTDHSSVAGAGERDWLRKNRGRGGTIQCSLAGGTRRWTLLRGADSCGGETATGTGGQCYAPPVST